MIGNLKTDSMISAEESIFIPNEGGIIQLSSY